LLILLTSVCFSKNLGTKLLSKSNSRNSKAISDSTNSISSNRARSAANPLSSSSGSSSSGSSSSGSSSSGSSSSGSNSETNKKCIEPKYSSLTKNLLNLSSVKAENDNQVNFVLKWISDNQGVPISPTDTIEVIKVLASTFASTPKSLEYFLNLFKNLFYINCKDLKTIVNNENDLKNRAIIIENIYTSLIDHDDVILEAIAEGLECDNRQKFKVLLKYSKPRDCIWGNIGEKIVFIFDLSGSMDYDFEFNGTKFTRLQFLKDNFYDAFSKFTVDQFYQIVTFSTDSQYLFDKKTNLIKATPNNIKLTISKVDNLEAGGYTNIEDALNDALDINANFDQIFLFTDGAATVGKQTADEIQNVILNKYKQRKSKNLNSMPINVNLLMLGGEEAQEEKDNAYKVASAIASVSGGSIKFFNK